MSTQMERKAKEPLDFHGPEEDWKTPKWGDLDTHKAVCKLYKMQQEKLFENYEGGDAARTLPR